MTIANESLIELIATANGRADAPMDADRAEACKQALAIHFICGTNARYKSYLTHLCNSFLDGMDY